MSSKVVGWLVKALLLALGVVFGLDLLAHFIAEFAWFKNLGYLSVFQTQLAVRMGLWVLALASTGGYLVGNLVLARRWRYRQPVDIDKTEPGALKLTQLLLVLVGLSLLLASLLTHIGQVIIQFWYPPTEIATSSSQNLQQFTFSATTDLLKHWLQMPWQLLLVAGFTAFFTLASWICTGCDRTLSQPGTRASRLQPLDHRFSLSARYAFQKHRSAVWP